MKLKKVLLIDDDNTVNFISKKLIERSGLTDEIVVKTSGQDALDTLQHDLENGNLPELILVDINMPGLDGWEFVNAFSKVVSDPSITKIILLTSLINPADVDRANNNPWVSAFKEKPVSMSMIEEIKNEVF